MLPKMCMLPAVELRKLCSLRISSEDCLMLQGKISLQTSSMVSSVHSTGKASARALSAVNIKNISIGRPVFLPIVKLTSKKTQLLHAGCNWKENVGWRFFKPHTKRKMGEQITLTRNQNKSMTPELEAMMSVHFAWFATWRNW
jgi:hypothetical protein